MKRLQLTVLTIFLLCTLNPGTSKTQTLQDVINEACAPSHYPFLPPCSNGITLEELNNRLNYKLHMMEAEDKQMTLTMSSWNKMLGLLYVQPTQKVWESCKNVAKAGSTDLVWPQASKAIDAQGVVFLADNNGDPDVVRKHILWYLIANGLDKERAEMLEGLNTNKIDPKLLFHVEPPHQ